MTRILVILCLLFAALPSRAQETTPESPEEERSLFLSFIENQLSTPNRQIRIRGIEGVLSSRASIQEITVADREGIWLRITGASIDWSRSALIFRQRLEISSLEAESIEMTRRPLPAENALPSPEARSFAVPELPIAINLDRVQVPSIAFGEAVFGLESTLSFEGRMRLEEGSLDTALEIERLDGPGGHLSLEAAFDNTTSRLDLDMALSEPQNGVIANLLNIEGRPPLDLTLAGAGPVDNLDLNLALAAAGEPALSGTARLRQQAEGIGFTLDAGGPIARLVPARFRSFFGAETTLEAAGLARSGGGFALSSLNLESAALRLDAAAETAEDGFLSRLTLNADIADPAGERVLLPLPGGETSVGAASLAIDFGNGGGDAWTASLNVTDLDTGGFSAREATFDVNGLAADLMVVDRRRITFDADGVVSGIIARQADVSEALGDTIRLNASGDWQAGEPLNLDSATLSGENLAASLAGMVSDFAFDGEIGVQTSSIAPFSGIAGRDLGGSIDLRATGELRPVSGAFDLMLDGTANDLRLDVSAADPLLVGATRITGRLARTVDGFLADGFRIESGRASFSADGTFATEAADFNFEAAIADLAHLTERAGGRLTATGRAQGSAGNLALSLEAAVQRGRLLDKELTEAALSFGGTLQNNVLAGQMAGSAFLDGVRAEIETDVRLSAEERQLSGIAFTAGGARLTGELVQDGEGLFTGNLALDAADISTAAALLLIEAQGAVNARLALENDAGRQQARIDATVNNLVAEQVSLESAEIEVDVADLFGVPAVAGRLQASGLDTAGIEVATLDATAQTSNGATAFQGRALLDNGTEITTRGGLAPENGGYTVTLEEAELVQAGVTARLMEPTRLTVIGDTVAFDRVDLDIAGGRLTAQGEIGTSLDVTLALEAVPLSIANAVRPDLALSGTLDGNATLSGTREAPRASFKLTGNEIAATALRQAGIASLGIEASGTTTDSTLSVNARMSSPGGLSATVEGDVPLGDGAIDLDMDLQSFPLSLLNARLPDLGLGGTLTGSAQISGSLADPRATFTAEAAGLNARPLAAFGAAPLNVNAAGRFAAGEVVLDSLNAAGPGGLSVTASGRIPLAGQALAVNAQGTVPLSLANRLLADRGAQLAGTLTADLDIGGSLANPAISGTLRTSDASAIDPMTNLRLTGIAIDAGISRNVITIRSGTAGFARGGTLAVSGSISIDAAAGFPADLTLRLQQVRYSDGEMVSATLDGSLQLAGALARDPLLSGDIAIDRAEILVPDSFGGGPAHVDVQHENPPPGVASTLRRARADDGTPVPSGRPSVLRLAVNVEAPARIFVRGRGLDAELGGSVRITGPITSVQPVGGFRLIRGRLAILAQRITFDEGTVTLIGDLDPFLDFVARSERSDITVLITVNGRVSDLSVDFSSQPELPEDEVLARLIFDRGVEELSPLQLAQLAAAAAELAGGSNGSLLGGFRNAVGLDELDIVTDSEGGAAVRVGRYIQENIYLGVEAGSAGSTRATINLDITENLKARGGFGTRGESDLGIFFERDY